jgi:acetyl-CoA carboxylase biotin carboxyl carrier protein
MEGAEKAWGLKEIEQLIDVLIDRQVTEFEMEQNGAKIRVKRDNHAAYSSGAPVPYVSSPASPPLSSVPASPPLSAPAPTPGADVSTPGTPPESSEDLYIMKSPIVGTFYSSPTPDAPSFASVGDIVRVGQVLCIIEAMKLMNELESEVDGEVVRVDVENGQPVEYGQSLFAIKPSPK